MKKISLVILLLFFMAELAFSQTMQSNLYIRKEHLLTLSLNTVMKIDSINIYKKPIKLTPLKEESEDVANTPILTNQNLLSYKNKEWARKLVIDDYWNKFPNQTIIDIHNTKKFIDEANMKIYFTVYFKFNNEECAFCYTEGQAYKKTKYFYSISVFKLIEGKWLLSDNEMFWRINDLAKIKPKFAKALVQAKEIKKNKEYTELFNLLYSDNILNLFDLNLTGQIKNDNFKTIFN